MDNTETTNEITEESTDKNPEAIEASAEETEESHEGSGRATSSKRERHGRRQKRQQNQPEQPQEAALPHWIGQDIPESSGVEITLKTLLEAGVHFGHQTSRWCPAMAPYIYGTRNGIHIINLPRTVSAWSAARKAVVDAVAGGGSVLFVGTKKQAQEAIVEEAKRCGGFFVSQRWLGGMLTNFSTIRKSIERLKKLEETLQAEEELISSGQSSKFTKKERLMIARDRDKLSSNLSGIREMNQLPRLLFVVDIKREEIAVKEAQRLDIPVIALVDTNCDPTSVTFPIPSNDDGTRAIRLFAQAVADAANEGRKQFLIRHRTQKSMEEKEGKRESRNRRSNTAERQEAEPAAVVEAQ